MNKDITKVTINGVELDYNWFDMEIRKKYMENVEKYSTKIDDLGKTLSDSPSETEEIAYYEKVCKLTFELFDNVFGKGTSDKVFKKKADFLACAEAVQILKDSRFEQQGHMESFTKAMASAV